MAEICIVDDIDVNVPYTLFETAVLPQLNITVGDTEEYTVLISGCYHWSLCRNPSLNLSTTSNPRLEQYGGVPSPQRPGGEQMRSRSRSGRFVEKFD